MSRPHLSNLSWFQAQAIQFRGWRRLARAGDLLQKFPNRRLHLSLSFFPKQVRSVGRSAWCCPPARYAHASRCPSQPASAVATFRLGKVKVPSPSSPARPLALGGACPLRLAGVAGRSAHAALHDSFDGTGGRTDGQRQQLRSCRRVVYSAAAAAAFVTLSLRYDFCIVGQGRRRR